MHTEKNVDITGLDKAEVLAALYNNSKQQGMGFLDSRGAVSMTPEEAQRAANDAGGWDFDYLYGRVLKVGLKGDSFNPWGYDRDNGNGAAERAIAPLRKEAK